MNAKMEKMIIIFIMACMAGFGTVLLLFGLLQIEILKYNLLTFAGLVAGLTGIYFGILLFMQMKED